MKEIEVGEYVRDCEGNIEKIINIINKDLYIGNYGNSYPKNCIVKHSPNIIDLIEVGDFVNGRLVLNVDYKNKNVCLLIPFTDTKANTNIMWYGYEEIKSIVTKQQFNSIAYRLEE